MGKFIADLVADKWLFTAAISQLLLVLLGAVVSLQEDWAKRHRALVLAAFAVLGCIGLIATAKRGSETATANQYLANSLGSLGDSTKEISRMTTLNTQLQEKLLQSSSAIAGLSKDNLNTITGGASYIYFDIASVVPVGNVLPGNGLNSGDILVSAFPHFVGRYPLNHVFVSVIGPLERLPEIDYGTVFPNEIGKTRPFVQLKLRPDKSKQFVNIFISASNGSYAQTIYFKRIGDKWLWANRFFKYPKKRPVRTWAVPGFPVAEINDKWGDD